jgi:ribosome maturation factor RimP
MHIEQQRKIRTILRTVLSPSTEAMGLYISGIEFAQEDRGPMVRIYIDGENGIGIAQCASLTKEFDPILDVEDPLPDAYILEVSSPGLDRVLEVDRDFERFKGFHLRVKRVHYKSKLDCVLLGHTPEGITVQTHIDERFIKFEDITQIRLHPTDEEIERIIAGATS